MYLSDFLDNLILIRKMIELFFYFLEAKSLEWLQNMMSSLTKKMKRILTRTSRLMKDTENMVHMFGEEQMVEQISYMFSTF